jgi:deoxyribose-phosphate aldolase
LVHELEKQGEGIDLAPLIEHTLLRPEATARDCEQLCREAMNFRFYGVCVPPNRVRLARSLLAGSGVKVVTVAGFPLGFQTVAVKVFEIENALAAGAEEIDAVLNIGALKEARFSFVEAEVRSLMEAVRAAGRSGARPLLKIIVETCYLSDTEKTQAARLVLEAGADFVKTSTGFAPGGARVEDVALLREAAGGRLKIKAAGGIRTRAQALALVAAGADRLGTSRGPALVKFES